MKHLLSLVIGTFAFLLPHHQLAPVSPVATTTPSISTAAHVPVKTVSQAKLKPSPAPAIPIVVPPVPVPSTLSAPVPVATTTESPTTTPPVATNPHHHSTPQDDIKIMGLQYDYDDYAADIKRLKDAAYTECVINPAIPSIAKIEALAISRGQGEYVTRCQEATNAATVGIQADQAAQADILQKIQNLQDTLAQ